MAVGSIFFSSPPVYTHTHNLPDVFTVYFVKSLWAVWTDGARAGWLLRARSSSNTRSREKDILWHIRFFSF